MDLLSLMHSTATYVSYHSERLGCQLTYRQAIIAAACIARQLEAQSSPIPSRKFVPLL